MAISGFTMAEANTILKRDYLNVVREQIPNKTPLYGRIQKSTESVVGEAAYLALHTGRNQSVGARSNADPALPKAGHQKYVQIRIETKNLYGRIEISGKVFKAAQSNRGAFLNAVEAELKGLTGGLTWDLNRQLFADGTGILGTIAAANSGDTAVTIESTFKNASYPTRWVSPNMRVDILDKSTPTSKRVAGATVTGVEKSTRVVSLGSALTAGANAGDYIVRENNYGLELTGLAAVFQADNELYGVDRSKAENAYFRPQILGNGGTLRSISELLIQQALDEVEINAGGNITLMISSHGVRRAYQDILTSLKRFNEPKRLSAGWTALDYNGIDWVVDGDCKANTLYMLDEPTWTIHTMIPEVFTWGEEDDQVLRQVTGYDSYEAFMLGYLELACDTPARNVVIQDITEK